MLSRGDQEHGLAPEEEVPRIFRVESDRIGGGTRSARYASTRANPAVAAIGKRVELM